MPVRNQPDDLDRLRAARPEVDDVLLSPHTPAAQALMEEIVTMESNRAVPSQLRPARRRRRGLLVACGATAAALVVGVAVVSTSGPTGRAHTAASASSTPTASRVVELANIRTIAARSGRALGASGRARITFDDLGGESGTTELAFSGHDVEMTIHFAGQRGGPGFDARNMMVGGEFYLYTPGSDGVVRWYHDTNGSGSSVFDSDPRTLLETLAPEAGFVRVGTDTIDGVEVMHLRATTLDALPSINLSLGPIDARNMKTLDLWVGSDDVVRRLDLTTEQQEQQIDPTTGPKLQKNSDGTVTVIDGNGNRQTVKGSKLDDVLKNYPHITRTYRSNYSVRFSDIGDPIAITVPPDAVDVAGQG